MNGGRLLIGVDCDEPLVDMNTYLQAWHNHEYGTKIRKEDVYTFKLWNVWKCEKDESTARIHKFYASSAFDQMTPTKGSIEGIEYLARHHDLLVLTSRSGVSVPKTKPFLDKHYFQKFSEIIFSGNYAMSNKKHITKAEICLEKGIDLLIEDCLRYALQCQEKEVPVILLDCPWNRERELQEEGLEKLPSGIVRAKDWQQILLGVDLFVKDRKRFYEIDSFD